MGFIHDKLDIKLLVLYIMTRVAAPIDFAALTDLSLCDDGVDYFQFSEAVAELVETEHLTLNEGLYAATDKGRRNGSVCESSVPGVVRARCDKNLARTNASLRRNAQVRSQVTPRPDGGYTLQLDLDDDSGNLLSLSLLTSSQSQGQELAARFTSYPEEIYNGVLSLLLREYSED